MAAVVVTLPFSIAHLHSWIRVLFLLSLFAAAFILLTQEKPHKCTLCAKSFPTPGDLKSHMYVHNGSWPFKCHICSRGFSKQTNLRNHLMHHAKGSSGGVLVTPLAPDANSSPSSSSSSSSSSSPSSQPVSPKSPASPNAPSQSESASDL